MVFKPSFEKKQDSPQTYVDGHSDLEQYREKRYEVYKTPEQKRIEELEAKNAKLLAKTREYLSLLEKFEDLAVESRALSAKEKSNKEENIYDRSLDRRRKRNSQKRDKRVDKAYWQRREEKEKNAR